jgi:hypothetical protein
VIGSGADSLGAAFFMLGLLSGGWGSCYLARDLKPIQIGRLTATMTRENPLDEEPFSYLQTKSGLVQIRYRGKIVTTLSGQSASRFLDRVKSGDRQAAQMAMAKATGQFKHGNERASRKTAKGSG